MIAWKSRRAIPAPGLTLALALLTLEGPAAAATWRVDAGAPAGGDGSSTAPFARVADGMAAAAPGDTVFLAAGVHSDTTPLTAYGQPRLALLELKAGVTVLGAGRDATILRALPATVYTFGVTAAGVGPDAVVQDLTVDGACFHGLNLRFASPTVRRVDLKNDTTATGSTVACDVRDSSFPVMEDVLFDGGHTALVVEFGSGGDYIGCTLGARPNSALLCNDAAPVMTSCRFLGSGRDVIVLNAGSQPRLRDCAIAAGARWTVRAALYPPGSTVDLSRNAWYSNDAAVILGDILDARTEPERGAVILIEPLAGGGVAVEPASLGSVKAAYR